MDLRPRMAAALARLREEGEPVWVTWKDRRLRLALPDEEFLERAEGKVIVATRRGYRRVVLSGRSEYRNGRIWSITEWQVIEPHRIRAVILEEHPRGSK